MQQFLFIVIVFSKILIISTSFSNYYNTSKIFLISLAITITISGYFSLLLNYFLCFSMPLNFIISILLCLIFGVLTELLIYKNMRKKKLQSFTILIASIGLYIILQNLISLTFGDDTKTLNTNKIVVGHEFLGAYITTIQILTIVVSLVLFIGMFLLYNYTTLGKQIRAVSENPELANVYGISQNKIILICTAISSALAAIAGILYAYDTNLTPTMGFNLLLYGIVAMIIGGVGSFRGLLFGSLLLATSQNLVAYYLDTKWMDAATYVILIAFLLWKPLGFSGKRLKKIEI